MSNTERHISLLQTLANDRHLVPHAQGNAPIGIRDFGCADTGIASVWFDRQTMVPSDDGDRVAYRAITARGELHWVVFTAGHTRAQSCRTDCPYHALEAVGQITAGHAEGSRKCVA